MLGLKAALNPDDVKLIEATLLEACDVALDALSRMEAHFSEDCIEYFVCHQAADAVRAAIASTKGEK